MSELENFKSLSEVPVEVSAVLGKTSLTIGELLSLKSGVILELDKKISDEIALCVNGKVVAKGELMVEDGQLGIVITQILQDKED